MTTFVNNDVASGNVIYAVDHNTQGALLAGVLNGNVDSSNLANNAVTTAKILDSNVTTAKIADDAVTAAKIDWATTGANGGIWWEELGRTTLGVAGDTITVSSFGARKYLKVLAYTVGAGVVTQQFTFNGDSATNYARRISINGAADSTNVNSTAIDVAAGDTNNTSLISFEALNVLASEKYIQGEIVLQAVGNNAPNRVEFVAKWVNTSAQITTVTLTNPGAGDFAIGSEVVVLGHN